MTAIDPYSPTTIMNAQASTGAGTAYAVAPLPQGMPSRWSWQVSVSGAPSGISTTLQGSLDGTLWSVIDTSTNTSGEAREVVFPATFVRANVGTLTGGTSPTVTVSVQPAL